jgi:hypothetical protein
MQVALGKCGCQAGNGVEMPVVGVYIIADRGAYPCFWNNIT